MCQLHDVKRQNAGIARFSTLLWLKAAPSVGRCNAALHKMLMLRLVAGDGKAWEPSSRAQRGGPMVRRGHWIATALRASR
jgi:hypothetical protein